MTDDNPSIDQQEGQQVEEQQTEGGQVAEATEPEQRDVEQNRKPHRPPSSLDEHEGRQAQQPDYEGDWGDGETSGCCFPRPDDEITLAVVRPFQLSKSVSANDGETWAGLIVVIDAESCV